MKWWWMFGILAIGGMMVVNETWYGNSAAFGTATGMVIVTLIGLRNLEGVFCNTNVHNNATKSTELCQLGFSVSTTHA